MASELRVNTLKDASGNNSIATSFVAGGSAKSWWQVDGTSTAHINDSFNTSGLTDHGTGDYQVNFTNNMGNINYANTSNSNNAHAINGKPNAADK